MRIALIGSGAAATGVLDGLAARGLEAEISLFDIGKNYPIPDWLVDRASMQISQSYAPLYRDIKHRRGLHFPPCKTYFGQVIERLAIDGVERLFTSNLLGGLTNHWGGLMLPFKANDFLDWPIPQSTLEPHYRAISELMGIAGEKDELTKLYGNTYINRPPMRVLDGIKQLQENVNRKKPGGSFRAIAGTSCIAGETRFDRPNRCVSCGECMAGCLIGAIYTAKTGIEHAILNKKVKFIKGKVVRISKDRTVEVAIKSKRQFFPGFDKIFLCAGCVGTTEILMKSLSINRGPILFDNAIYNFPILNFSTHSDPVKSEYSGLTNSLVMFEPTQESEFPLQLQLYPNADYLWRNAVPEWLWPAAGIFTKFFRDRLIIGRLYLHSRHSFQFESYLKNGCIEFTLLKKPEKGFMQPIWKQVRKKLGGRGYYVPSGFPNLAETSAHLAGTFPYGGNLARVKPNGEVRPGVYIADSACFPHSPVTPPTFTIMANARRTAMEAVASGPSP